MRNTSIALIAFATVFGLARAADDYKIGDRLAEPKKPAAAEAAAAFKTVNWDALVPKDWDPMKEFKDMNMALMSDGDPRATEMLIKMQRAWENAPVEPSLDGARIRIPGFIVPIEEAKGTISEFLLVPYFGACIHVPPPPANQIIYVVPVKPVKGFGMMDAVWVNGTLRTVRSNKSAGMGLASAGYRLDAQGVEPYKKQ